MSVYRGITGNFISGLISYVSTSYDVDKAYNFTNPQRTCCLLRITVSTGSKVLPIEYISEVQHEKEILLPPFGRIEITHEFYDGAMKVYDLVYLRENLYDHVYFEGLAPLGGNNYSIGLGS